MIIFQEFCSDPLWNQTNTTIIGISSSKYNNWMKRTKKRITWNSCLNFNSHKNGKIKFFSFFFLLQITKQKTNQFVCLLVSDMKRISFSFFSRFLTLSPHYGQGLNFKFQFLSHYFVAICLFVCLSSEE